MLYLLKTAFSTALRARREELGITQEKMAEKCCISNREYSALENRRRLPKFKTAIDIAIVCNMDLNGLIRDLQKKGYRVTDDYSKP